MVRGVTIFERLAQAIHAEMPVALVTRMDDHAIGAKLLVFEDESIGDLGSAGLTQAATQEALAALFAGEPVLRSFGPEGEPIGIEAHIFIQPFTPAPDMYIFGAVDFSRSMARLGKYLGFRVTVVDARPAFATRTRIPDADDVVVAWPDQFLVHARVTPRTAIIILTHDPKFDIPILQVALRTSAGYIGAMGSRRTHGERVSQLKELGVSDVDLARICAPVGLDIGARTPQETAVSIAAEIVALRSGRTGGRLVNSTRSIHASQPA
jgi:xanthine dehydrogenase accessory factor